MKRVTFLYEENEEGLIIYPDDISMFWNVEISDGKIYADYSGTLQLTEIKPHFIDVQSITGTKQVNSDNSFATCFEDTNVTISGNLDIPDRDFNLPIRRDDGRIFLFNAEVRSGQFNVIVNFPTVGKFTYSDEEANIDLPPNTFTVNTIKFDVLRKVFI